MNPSRALAPWMRNPLRNEASHSNHPDLAFEAWSQATGLVVPPRERVLSTGVRDLLRAAFVALAEAHHELWLPADVYPVYWELARTARFSPLPFATLPTLDVSFLDEAGPNSIALVPIPLSPLGRWPSEAESERLVRWLTAYRDRILIVDAVYTYDFEASQLALDPLLATDRCLVLWSCSKSWLAPGAFGIARVPESWAPRIRDSVPPPNCGPGQAIVERLQGWPDLPRQQARGFRQEWARLEPRIRSAQPEWRPPACGYFATVTVPFETLLRDHRILSIPASVFGSERQDVCVVTCLHDLASHQLEATSA